MPERTGAHCLYDRFAAAVRRQITIAIPGSLRKKPRRRQRLSPRAAHNEIRIPLPASVQRNSRAQSGQDRGSRGWSVTSPGKPLALCQQCD